MRSIAPVDHLTARETLAKPDEAARSFPRYASMQSPKPDDDLIRDLFFFFSRVDA